MVGIKVGGTNSGGDVGWAVAVAVGLGLGVNVTVAAVDGNEVGDGVAVTDCPHALNNKPMTRKTMTRTSFFMLTHSLGTMLDVWLPTVPVFYRQGRFVGK